MVIGKTSFKDKHSGFTFNVSTPDNTQQIDHNTRKQVDEIVVHHQPSMMLSGEHDSSPSFDFVEYNVNNPAKVPSRGTGFV